MRTVISAIGDSDPPVGSVTEQLSASAQDMARLATESLQQTEIVARAANQMSGRRAETVAAGSERMGTSTREMARNASEVSWGAWKAVTAATPLEQTATPTGMNRDVPEAALSAGQVADDIGAAATGDHLNRPRDDRRSRGRRRGRPHGYDAAELRRALPVLSRHRTAAQVAAARSVLRRHGRRPQGGEFRTLSAS